MEFKKRLTSILVGASLFLTGCKSNTTFFSDLEKLSGFSGGITADVVTADTKLSVAGDVIDFDAMSLAGNITTNTIDADYKVTITDGNIYIERAFLLTILQGLDYKFPDIFLVEDSTEEYICTPFPTKLDVGINKIEKQKYRVALKTFVRQLYLKLKTILTADDTDFLITTDEGNALVFSKDGLDYLYAEVETFFEDYPLFVEQVVELVKPWLTDAQCSQFEDLILSLKSEHLLSFITSLNEQLSVGEYYLCLITTSDMEAEPTMEVVFKRISLTEGECDYATIKFVSRSPIIRIPDSATDLTLLHHFIL